MRGLSVLKSGFSRSWKQKRPSLWRMLGCWEDDLSYVVVGVLDFVWRSCCCIPVTDAFVRL